MPVASILHILSLILSRAETRLFYYFSTENSLTMQLCVSHLCRENVRLRTLRKWIDFLEKMQKLFLLDPIRYLGRVSVCATAFPFFSAQ